MLYGTPTRAAHRASAGGGLALPVRGVGNTGQHRPAARRRAPREPQRAAQLLAQGLAALIVLAVTTLIGFFIVAGEQPSGEAASTPLASRAEDPEPLSLEEVFPDDRVVRPPAAAPYRITVMHVDTDCRVATVGTLGGLLAGHGCSQVVRAGLTAPYDDYQVTAGVFNLPDAATAEDVDDSVRRLVETGDGNFATLSAGTETSQVGWHARGHYLLYCVITRAGGQLVGSDDPYAERITEDLVDGYLGDTLERRASGF